MKTDAMYTPTSTKYCAKPIYTTLTEVPSRLLVMVPPIECDLSYRFRTRTLNPNFNRNPKTDPDPNPNPNPKSNNNVCSAKRHPNKVQIVL